MGLRTSFALTGILAAVGTQAANWTVTETGDTGDGSCDASCTLRDAINAAQEDDRVFFDPGLATPISIGLTGPALQVDVPLRIVGTDGVRTTLRRASGAGRLLELSGDGDARIIGLSFEDNSLTETGAATTGAAVLVGAGTTLELRDCVFRNNTALGAPNTIGGPGWPGRGGAIHAIGSLLVENCAFVGNRAFGGAAMSSGGAGGDAIGGAIYAEDNLTVLNATFSGNVAQGGTGGLGSVSPVPVFPGGPGGNGGAGSGGAIAVTATSAATVAFSTLIANSVIGGTGGPGGIGTPPGPPGNTGAALGSAVTNAAPTILDASVVAGNGAVSACEGAALTARTSNRVDDTSCPGLLVAALVDEFNALAVNAASPHYLPIDGSIVVDTTPDCLDALGAESVDLDQLLTTRPLRGNGVTTACDYGAIELNPVLFADGFEEPPPP